MKKITVWVTGATEEDMPSENVVHMTRLMANENFNDWKADPDYDARRLVLDKLTISGAGWREVAGHAIAAGAQVLDALGWSDTSTTGDADSEWKTVRERQPRRTRRR